MFGQEGQRRREKVALLEPHFNQFHRQRGGGFVELLPGDFLPGVGVDKGQRRGLGARPFGDDAMQQVPIGEVRLIMSQRHLRDAMSLLNLHDFFLQAAGVYESNLNTRCALSCMNRARTSGGKSSASACCVQVSKDNCGKLVANSTLSLP